MMKYGIGDTMAKSLSDHQDSEHFSYSRTWDEIESMLDKAEKNLELSRIENDAIPS